MTAIIAPHISRSENEHIFIRECEGIAIDNFSSRTFSFYFTRGLFLVLGSCKTSETMSNPSGVRSACSRTLRRVYQTGILGELMDYHNVMRMNVRDKIYRGLSDFNQ